MTKMKYYTFIKLFFILFITGFVSLFSQSIDVSVRDTVIERGKTDSYAYINIKTEGISASSLSLDLIFNANVLDFKKGTYTSNIGNLKSLTVDCDLSDLQNSVLKLQIEPNDNISDLSFGVPCEGLAGNDTITMLTPSKIIINNIEYSINNSQPGKIIVRSSIVIEGITEGLFQNYPNPFSLSTIFPFGLNKDSKIILKAYSLNGRKIIDAQNFDKIFNVEVISQSNEVFDNYLEVTFKRGNYKLNINPLSWELSAGVYLIVLETGTGAYKSNFMFIK